MVIARYCSTPPLEAALCRRTGAPAAPRAAIPLPLPIKEVQGVGGSTASTRGCPMKSRVTPAGSGCFSSSLLGKRPSEAQTAVPATGAAVPSERAITLIEVDLQTASPPLLPPPPQCPPLPDSRFSAQWHRCCFVLPRTKQLLAANPAREINEGDY